MALTPTALNQAANAVVINKIRLHSGAPGADGNSNVIANTDTNITMGAATNGVRTMTAAVDIDVPAGTVSHYSLWDGTTLKATSAFTTPETYNAPGIAKINAASVSITNA